MKRTVSRIIIIALLIIALFIFLAKVQASDYPHDYRGEITNVVIYPSLPSYQGETPSIWVEFRNPTGTTYHYLVVVNIFDSTNEKVYDSDIEGENVDGYVNGGDTVAWGPWEYTIPSDAAVGTWHVLAGLRLYPWEPELDYIGESWCEPEVTFLVKPSHETIEGASGDSYDYDGDGCSDSVRIQVLAQTNALEEVDVEAYGDLRDPDGNVVDNEGSGLWAVPAGGQSWSFPFYLFVPSGSPVGTYTVDLYLYDETHRNNYPDPEDVELDAISIFLYPPGYCFPQITVNPNGGRIFVDGNPITTTTQYSWESGSSHTLDPDSGYSPSTDTRLLFQQWNDGNTEDPRSITVNGDATYTTDWNTEHYVTFQQSGCIGTPHVAVDGESHTLPYSIWMDSESSHDFIYESPVNVGGDQWTLTSTSHSSPLIVTVPTTVTGYYSLSNEIELYYDDGICDDGYAPTMGLYTYAVHFVTPTLHSYMLGKVKYYIHASPASFYIDIRGGALQQLHYELVTPTEIGWFVVDLTSQRIFVRGDFYVGMKYSQLYEPELGADYTDPDGESGESSVSFPEPNLNSLDWMIRVVLGGKMLGVVHQVQRKDTEMLCLGWGPNGESYDGQLAWDGPHPVDLDHPTGSLLDDKYCARASVSMIVSYYGGSLSQDRISYYYFEEWSGSPYRDGKPEGDLGCGSGMWGEDVLSWALNGATLTHHNGKPSFYSQIKLWIDQDRPIYVRYIWYEGDIEKFHAMVVDGYDVYDERVHVLDPWYVDGNGSDSVWVSYSDFESTYGNIDKALVPYSGAIGRSDEPTVGVDSDGDEVCDFDEIHRFGTNPHSSDSDGDGVGDKEEIVSYTFLNDHSYDNSDSRKPDPDNDDLRAELDLDSDDGGVQDGVEDTNGNGFVDPGETDPLNPSDDPNKIHLESREDDDASSSLGTITFDGSTYSLPDDITKPAETYPVQYNSVLGYEFDHWETMDGITVTDPSAQSTTATVTGGGTLTAIYIACVHDLAVTNVIPSEIKVYEGDIVSVNITVRNEGTVSEVFNVTAYYDSNVIQSQTNVALNPSVETTLTFSWNTTGLPGNHRLSAEASIVLGETDTSDNTFFNGIVEVVTRIVAPVNGQNTSIEGNVTLTDTAIAKNTLHFDASGPSGSTGWINVTFPMINTTEIKVFINQEKLTPPPFPIITTNETHYFIYFEFPLSAHEIIIQYAIVDIAVTSIEARPTNVPRGQPVYINVTVENQGDFEETFNVNVYADQWGTDAHFDIGNKTMSLDIGESQLLEFVWDTTSVPCGTYWITAEAILPEDADPADNIARTKVGGICIPYSQPPLDIVGLLIPIASMILAVFLLGVVAFGLFKILMSPRLRWPW